MASSSVEGYKVTTGKGEVVYRYNVAGGVVTSSNPLSIPKQSDPKKGSYGSSPSEVKVTTVVVPSGDSYVTTEKKETSVVNRGSVPVEKLSYSSNNNRPGVYAEVGESGITGRTFVADPVLSGVLSERGKVTSQEENKKAIESFMSVSNYNYDEQLRSSPVVKKDVSVSYGGSLIDLKNNLVGKSVFVANQFAPPDVKSAAKTSVVGVAKAGIISGILLESGKSAIAYGVVGSRERMLNVINKIPIVRDIERYNFLDVAINKVSRDEQLSVVKAGLDLPFFGQQGVVYVVSSGSKVLLGEKLSKGELVQAGGYILPFALKGVGKVYRSVPLLEKGVSKIASVNLTPPEIVGGLGEVYSFMKVDFNLGNFVRRSTGAFLLGSFIYSGSKDVLKASSGSKVEVFRQELLRPVQLGELGFKSSEKLGGFVSSVGRINVPISRLQRPEITTGDLRYGTVKGNSVSVSESIFSKGFSGLKPFGLPKEQVGDNYYFTATPNSFKDKTMINTGSSETAAQSGAPELVSTFLKVGGESRSVLSVEVGLPSDPMILRTRVGEFGKVPGGYVGRSGDVLQKEINFLFPSSGFSVNSNYVREQSYLLDLLYSGRSDKVGLILGKKAEVESLVSAGTITKEVGSGFKTVVPDKALASSREVLFYSSSGRYEFVKRVKGVSLKSPSSFLDFENVRAVVGGKKAGQFLRFNFKSSEGIDVPISQRELSNDLQFGNLVLKSKIGLMKGFSSGEVVGSSRVIKSGSVSSFGLSSGLYYLGSVRGYSGSGGYSSGLSRLSYSGGGSVGRSYSGSGGYSSGLSRLSYSGVSYGSRGYSGSGGYSSGLSRLSYSGGGSVGRSYSGGYSYKSVVNPPKKVFYSSDDNYYKGKKLESNVLNKKRKSKYVPSLQAEFFNIRGKRPSRFGVSSGSVIRPIELKIGG